MNCRERSALSYNNIKMNQILKITNHADPAGVSITTIPVAGPVTITKLSQEVLDAETQKAKETAEGPANASMPVLPYATISSGKEHIANLMKGQTAEVIYNGILINAINESA